MEHRVPVMSRTFRTRSQQKDLRWALALGREPPSESGMPFLVSLWRHLVGTFSVQLHTSLPGGARTVRGGQGLTRSHQAGLKGTAWSPA